MKIAVVFANGTEEIEGITPVDILRRADVTCDIVSVSGVEPVGSHGIAIKADLLSSQLKMDDYDGIVIPGGMPGATNIANDEYVNNALLKANKDGKLIASICASPAVVLQPLGVLDGRKATCFNAPIFVEKLGKSYTGKGVEIDGHVITANGPKSAMDFAIEICKYLKVKPKI